MTDSDNQYLSPMGALFRENPTKPLFHYTSLRGIRGIVESKEIWATNARFLNDKMELVYLATIAERLIGQRIDAEPSRSGDLRELGSAIAGWKATHSRPGAVYVSSFSENGDQLSQWRGYSPEGGGVSIGFDGNGLHVAMFERGVITVKIVYDLSRQEKIVNGLLDFLLHGDWSPTPKGSPRIESAKALLYEMLSFCAPAFKDPAFAEEEEWRLIYAEQYPNLLRSFAPLDVTTNFLPKLAVQYRETPRMFVPYVALPLALEDECLEFLSVTVGPSADDALGAESLRDFLVSRRVSVGGVAPSKIPLRPS